MDRAPTERGSCGAASRSRLSSRVAPWALVTVALATGGCAVSDPSEESDLTEKLAPETPDELAATPWQPIGTGVSYKRWGEGADVLVVYGGYTAKDAYVQRWADELVRQKLSSYGHLYAVRGPNQSAYANREIANSKLAAHLGDGRAAAASHITIVAHSSGTFVATELAGMLHQGRAGSGALAKVALYNLDGGGIDGGLVGEMGSVFFVYACDHDIGRCSHNASSMKSLGATFASKGGAVELDASRSGCSKSAAGGLWCLHDTLVTSRPHNPTAYDLKNDYTEFDDQRSVVTAYLDTAAP